MTRHKVTKTVDFCYGHRLMEYDGKCRHLHGHNGLLEVDLEADSLDSLGMVMDFTRVSDIVKGWVDENLDHKALFEIHRKATTQAIHKAMNNEPSIDWLLEHQEEITHKYYQKGLDGTL